MQDELDVPRFRHVLDEGVEPRRQGIVPGLVSFDDPPIDDVFHRKGDQFVGFVPFGTDDGGEVTADQLRVVAPRRHFRQQVRETREHDNRRRDGQNDDEENQPLYQGLQAFVRRP